MRLSKIKNENSGFTLVEMLIVIILVAVCGIIVSQMFIGQNRIYKVQMSELQVTSDARSAADGIDDYVRQAQRTLDSFSTFTAGSQVLILQLRSVNASNQLIPAVYDTVVFYLDGSSLYMQVFPDPTSARAAITKKLAATVNSLNFTYNNADYSLVTKVTTDLTTQENSGVQTRAITVSVESSLRNY